MSGQNWFWLNIESEWSDKCVVFDCYNLHWCGSNVCATVLEMHTHGIGMLILGPGHSLNRFPQWFSLCSRSYGIQSTVYIVNHDSLTSLLCLFIPFSHSLTRCLTKLRDLGTWRSLYCLPWWDCESWWVHTGHVMIMWLSCDCAEWLWGVCGDGEWTAIWEALHWHGS